MNNEQIKRKVRELTAKYNSRDPFALCREMGIEILFVKLTKHVRGFYQRIDTLDIIYLSDSLTENEQIPVLAHELGHCLLHSGLNFFFVTRSTLYPVGKFEKEADEFARLLLEETDIDLSCISPEVRKILLS